MCVCVWGGDLDTGYLSVNLFFLLLSLLLHIEAQRGLKKSVAFNTKQMDYHEKSPQKFVGSLLFYTLLLHNYYLTTIMVNSKFRKTTLILNYYLDDLYKVNSF